MRLVLFYKIVHKKKNSNIKNLTKTKLIIYKKKKIYLITKKTYVKNKSFCTCYILENY